MRPVAVSGRHVAAISTTWPARLLVLDAERGAVVHDQESPEALALAVLPERLLVLGGKNCALLTPWPVKG